MDLNFEQEEVFEESDDESVDNEEEEIPLENWTISRRDFNNFSIVSYISDSIEDRRYEDNIEAFVDEIVQAYENTRYVTAIRLRADLIPLNVNENEIIRDRNIRFEINRDMSNESFREMLIKFIYDNEAPTWVKQGTDEGSDDVVDRSVIYKLDGFDLIINSPSPSPYHVTSNAGEVEIYAGVFIRQIAHHNNIGYFTNDCLIRCLNEALNKRYLPKDVRKSIWPRLDYEKSRKKYISKKRHMLAICRYYNAEIILTDMINSKKIRFYDVELSNPAKVELIKVGSVIGILDRFERNFKPKDLSIKYLCYDLETIGENQRVYAYSIDEQGYTKTICDTDFNFVEKSLALDFITRCENQSEESTRVCYAWNGSKFDSWIVLRVLKDNYGKDVRISSIVKNNANELLMFTLYVNKNKLVFKDPKKMFSLPLENAARLFNIDLEKEKMDHDEIEELYYRDRKYFNEYVTENKTKIMSYVRKDVEILCRIVEKILDIYKDQDIDALKTLTRSVASANMWVKSMGCDASKKLKDVSIEVHSQIVGVTYSDLISHSIGGRTQCVRQGEFDNVTIIDVNSMYPHVCATNLYPCGDIIETNEYVSGKLGFYEVEILKQSKPNVVPYRKTSNDAYDWDYDKPFVKWITSVDLEQIDEYKVIKGFYWTDSTDQFYKKFMMDTYDKRIQSDKRHPMNMHMKMLMNSVTGAVFQNSFREITHIGTSEYIESLSKKYCDVVEFVDIDRMGKEEWIATFRPKRLKPNDPKIKAQKEFCKGGITKKPWILTTFTYSYARKMLRDKWIELEKLGCEVLYCDTDSIAFMNPNQIPIEHSIDMGGWGVECKNKKAVFYKSKIYAVKDYALNLDKIFVDKIRLKGVGFRDFVIGKEDYKEDMGYEEKGNLYRKILKIGKTVKYNDVRKLLDGEILYTINFYMRKNLKKGVEKVYTIKKIK